MPRINKSHVSTYFEKKFNKLPKKIQKIAAKKLLFFEENPSHPSLKIHKLKGNLSAYWSIYINTNYRVLLRFLVNNEVLYCNIDTHDIYR